MKKLLIATDNFLPRMDGIVRFLLEVIPSLTDHFDITILAPDFGGNPKVEKTKLIRFPTFKFQLGDIHLSKPNLKLIKKEIEDADIIWAQSVGPISSTSIYFARKSSKKVVSYIHALEWELFSNSVRYFKKTVGAVSKILVRKIYNMCDLILVPSLEIGEIMNYRGIKTPFQVVHLGIDVQKFIPSDNKAAKRELNIPEKTIVIGYTGRIAREKDLLTLYKAFQRFQEWYEKSNLLIVGGGIPKLHAELESKPDVRMEGPVDNVIPYLQAMDIFVLPSLTETSSLATMEAMSCGIPVVATKVGYVKEYIKNKINGLLVPKQNDVVLSLKLKWLMDHPQLKDIIAMNGRNSIIENFKLSTTQNRIRDILISL